MGFKKGNQYGKKNKGIKKAKTVQWENIVGWLVGDGGAAFKENLIKLSNGKEINKPKTQFIEYYMALLEYHQPKLSRAEYSGPDGGPIPLSVEKADAINKALDEL